MFIGHFAAALAAKRAAPSVSLGVLFAACQFADLLWPNLVLAGIERVEIDPGNTAFTPLNFVFYPYSHSLVALLGWSAIAIVLYRLVRPATWLGPIVVGALVVSHWVLDAVSHRPDMPLSVSGQPRVGLGLWNSVPATVVVETAMFVVGLALYARVTRPADRVGTIGFWSLIGLLVLIDVANIAGPPPPSVIAVAVAAQAMWLIIFWASWADGHRMSTANTLTSTKYKVRSTKY